MPNDRPVLADSTSLLAIPILLLFLKVHLAFLFPNEPAHKRIRRKTHVPLKAPTGLRTGAATTVSCMRCEVWNERRRAAAAALLWARVVVVGRERAALRSAEGMREAMVLV
jgi:hypothetical protein